jgi:hypothetical protein
LVYANTYLTDGFVPSDGLSAVWPWSRAGRYAARLVQVGLWDKVKDGYHIHDFKDFNPSAQTIKTKRESDRLRKHPTGIQAESVGNPSGVQADSVRNPSAPSRARAIPSHPIRSTRTKDKSRGADAPHDNLSIITKIAHEVLASSNGAEDGDLAERMKTLCATRRIVYNSTEVYKAIDSARHQRKLS